MTQDFVKVQPVYGTISKHNFVVIDDACTGPSDFNLFT